MDLSEFVEEMPNMVGSLELLLRFFLNTIIITIIIHLLYYPKSRRIDYYFTFMLISVSIFFLIFLLGSVKLKIGFALGLFAIFGIIRYRTESMPVREMTYLFVIIAVSVINALCSIDNYLELLISNTLFILTIWILESNRWLKHISEKLIVYDRVDLIQPEKHDEMMADLIKRTGLDIKRFDVGAIDYLRDTAMVKIYYDLKDNEHNTIDTMLKLPKENKK